MIDTVLSDVIDRLNCSVCQDGLRLSADGRSLVCPAGHAFDVAKQGYVNLLPGGVRPSTADTADMVQARAEFLGVGHFAPLAERLAETVRTAMPDRPAAGADRCVVDAGAGTGYYLGAVLDRLEAAVGIALDLSKYALRRAARSHPRLGAAVCDLWRPIPVRTATADAILNVFAPRNGAEYARLLRPGGSLFVVTPTAGHLQELVGRLGLLTVDEHKRDRIAQSLGDHFATVAEESCEMALRLGHGDVETLVGMGPSAHHISPTELRDRIAKLPDQIDVTAAFSLLTLQPLA